MRWCITPKAEALYVLSSHFIKSDCSESNIFPRGKARRRRNTPKAEASQVCSCAFVGLTDCSKTIVSLRREARRSVLVAH